MPIKLDCKFLGKSGKSCIILDRLYCKVEDACKFYKIKDSDGEQQQETTAEPEDGERVL